MGVYAREAYRCHVDIQQVPEREGLASMADINNDDHYFLAAAGAILVKQLVEVLKFVAFRTSVLIGILWCHVERKYGSKGSGIWHIEISA